MSLEDDPFRLEVLLGPLEPAQVDQGEEQEIAGRRKLEERDVEEAIVDASLGRDPPAVTEKIRLDDDAVEKGDPERLVLEGPAPVVDAVEELDLLFGQDPDGFRGIFRDSEGFAEGAPAPEGDDAEDDVFLLGGDQDALEDVGHGPVASDGDDDIRFESPFRFLLSRWRRVFALIIPSRHPTEA